MPNIELKPKHDLSTFRRIAIGTWTTVGDPSVYGSQSWGSRDPGQEVFRA